MNQFSAQPYYAATAAPKRLPESLAEIRLLQVLTRDAHREVVEAVNRWNGPLRAEVRALTALKLTDDSGRSSTKLPVAIIDGMPKPLADVTGEIEPWQWWLVLNRPALELADHGLKLLIEQEKLLSQHVGEVPTRIGAVWLSRNLIGDIVKKSIDEDILARFKKIEEDILGAYWMNASCIHIYWMPLAIFASLFRVTLSTLTVAVLCHELVHAYSHRGMDIDGSSWPTGYFIKTDTYVKEGLAQYYTEQVMRSLQSRLPDGLNTFLAKTAKQSAPYTAYQNWLEKKQPSPEVVRLAMLAFRNSNPPLLTNEKFLQMLKASEAQIRGG